MKSVLIRGPLLSQSGYGVHSRQIYKFCEAQKDWNVSTQALPWGITPWNINSEDEDGIYGRIMSKSARQNQKFDISIQIQLPHEWDTNLANYNIGVTAGVETTACSVEWSNHHCDKMDLVIVPSNFAKKTLVKSHIGPLKTPVEVLPEAYFSELLEDPETDPLQDIPTQKNILMVGTLTSEAPESDRKNLVNSIVWFMKAFQGKPDVGLVVKTSKGRDTTIDRQLVRKMLEQVKKYSGVSGKKAPKLYMLHGSMSRAEMRDLYKSPKISAYASATRGEGFGLPLLEAAISGLPVVATNWSAHTEFLSGDSFLDTAYDLKVVPSTRVDGKIFVADAMWAEPREGNFSRKLKIAVAENRKLKEKALDLSAELQDSHSLDTLCRQFENIIKEHYKK
jgi:glycosyltransferase involved in cell wall biosynthesis